MNTLPPTPADALAASSEPLAEVVRLARVAETARTVARDAAARRDAAVVAAVRAGAGLGEIAIAAGITRAAVSHAARKTLPARPVHGGPYARRRGSRDAVRAVDDLATGHREAILGARSAVADRDRAIATAVSEGAGIREIARTASLPVASVSVAARSSRS